MKAEVVSSWSIQDNYLSSGKLTIYNTGSTTIKFDIQAVRFATNGVAEAANIQFFLIAFPNSSGNPVVISSTFTITTSDFSSNSLDNNWLTVNKTYTVDIPYSSVQGIANIGLGWISTAFPGNNPIGYNIDNKSYQIILSSAPPSPPAFSCTGTTNINSGTIASGTTKNGNINVGMGSNGSGTITTNSTATTTLIAVNDIVFNSEFHATVTNGSFNAKLVSCSNLPSARYIDTTSKLKLDSLSKLTTINVSETQKDNDIHIYPIPSNGPIEIALNLGNFKKTQISIINQSGSEVFTLTHKTSDGKTIRLNLGFLTNGIYYIKINSINKIVTKKIIIIK